MPRTYKFTIKIDNEDHTLSKENGLPIQKLGELLLGLFKAIEQIDSSDKCTVNEIVGGSYGVEIITESEYVHAGLEIVHKNVQNTPIDELPENERGYATTLKKILGGQLFLKAENNDGKEVASIKTLERQTTVDAYYSTDTLYGILSQIGSPHIDSPKKWIYIDGVSYRISVTKEQDAQLKQYYSSHKLRVKVRHKRYTADGHIMSAELISFVVVEQTDIVDTLKNVGYVDFALIKDAHTIDEIVDRIYGDK